MADLIVSPRFDRPSFPNDGWLQAVVPVFNAYAVAAVLAAQMNCSYVPYGKIRAAVLPVQVQTPVRFAAPLVGDIIFYGQEF